MKLYKIIQLLRLSRLVLLVILLLIAVAAKIARAETALMYYVYQRQALGYFATPQAACSASDKPMFRPPQNDSPTNWTAGYCRKDEREPSYVHYTVMKSSKTCDAKELTHNGVSDGVDMSGIKNVFMMRAPKGIDAADWYSDRFNTCENNCVVLNTRDPFFDKSINESDGTSRSAFFKKQTGSVCVVEKKKPDDPPKPPSPDTGDGADGNGQGNPGTGNGQGDGSDSEGGSSSQGGSDGQGNQGSGNSNGSGSSSGGSGGGSGGGNGGSLQISPGGGGTSGGTDSGNEGSGSEGGTGDGQSGSGQSGGGSGDSGGQGGSDGSGEGEVDSDGEAGGHYFPCPSGKGSYKKGSRMSPECAGEGNGDGDGSIGGGSCEADTPPDCKGDPIQCYIAREQWRTACAASGKGNKVEGEGNCQRQTPPECKGDATQCYIVKQQFLEGCARQSLEDYGRGQAAKAQAYLEGDGFDGIGEDLKDNNSTVDIPRELKMTGYGLSRSCPTLRFDIDAKVFGVFNIDLSQVCGLANLLGNLFVALTLVLSARYILR